MHLVCQMHKVSFGWHNCHRPIGDRLVLLVSTTPLWFVLQFWCNEHNEVEMQHKRFSITKEWKPTDRSDGQRLVVIKAEEECPPLSNLRQLREMLPTRGDTTLCKPVWLGCGSSLFGCDVVLNSFFCLHSYQLSCLLYLSQRASQPQFSFT